jgi:hypothetical protein
MNTLLQIALCSAWGIILADELQPLKNIRTEIINNTMHTGDSGRWSLWKSVVLYFVQAIDCSKCLSYHLFWITWLVLYGNFYGIVCGVGSYFLTFAFKKLTE